MHPRWPLQRRRRLPPRTPAEACCLTLPLNYYFFAANLCLFIENWITFGLWFRMKYLIFRANVVHVTASWSFVALQMYCIYKNRCYSSPWSSKNMHPIYRIISLSRKLEKMTRATSHIYTSSISAISRTYITMKMMHRSTQTGIASSTSSSIVRCKDSADSREQEFKLQMMVFIIYKNS